MLPTGPTGHNNVTGRSQAGRECTGSWRRPSFRQQPAAGSGGAATGTAGARGTRPACKTAHLLARRVHGSLAPGDRLGLMVAPSNPSKARGGLAAPHRGGGCHGGLHGGRAWRGQGGEVCRRRATCGLHQRHAASYAPGRALSGSAWLPKRPGRPQVRPCVKPWQVCWPAHVRLTGPPPPHQHLPIAVDLAHKPRYRADCSGNGWPNQAPPPSWFAPAPCNVQGAGVATAVRQCYKSVNTWGSSG